MNTTSEQDIVRVDPMLQDLIPGFMKNRMNDIEALERLYAQRDFEGVVRFGHQLKGVGLNYGFLKLGGLGEALEKIGKEKDLESLRQTMNEISRHIKNVEIVFS